MELVWGLKRVFKRERYGTSVGAVSEEEKNMDVEGPSVMVVRGKDTMRGEGGGGGVPASSGYKSEEESASDRKLNKGRSWETLPVTNLDESVGVEKAQGDGPQRKSAWVPKKMGQWLKLLDLAAARKRKHSSTMRGTTCPSCAERRLRPSRRASVYVGTGQVHSIIV